MIHHKHLTDIELKKLLKNKQIQYAGWLKGKIFGHLKCPSGKKNMSRKTRVFFKSIEEAESLGFRPCAKCMKEAYKNWKTIRNEQK